jgi:hypothetical protein
VEKLRGVDHIDPMYKNPFSYLQKYFRGAVHWCPFCRLQFYDIRKRMRFSRRPPPEQTPQVVDLPESDIADPAE